MNLSIKGSPKKIDKAKNPIVNKGHFDFLLCFILLKMEL